MSRQVDIRTRFKDERVVITAYARNRDKSVLTDAANSNLKLVIGATRSGASLLEFNTSPQVILSDASLAKWLITLSRTDLASLNEDTTYFYNLWSTSATDVRIVQNYGKFILLQSISVA